MMQAMFEGLTGWLSGGKPILYATVSCRLPEGIIADELMLLQDRHPEVDIGSYPYFKSGVIGVNLVIRGIDIDSINNATDDISEMIRVLGCEPIFKS